MYPYLPPELVNEIIIQTWGLECSVTERILLMISLPLVSRTVLDAYLRISSIDVHIPCPSFVRQYRLAIEGTRGFPIKPAGAYNLADLCRSITIQIKQPFPPTRAIHWSAEPPMGIALSDLLYDIRLFGGLPNFRTLTIRYVDVDLNDIFDWARFIDFPKTVEVLNLEFKRTEPELPPPKIVVTPPSQSLTVLLWSLPSVRRLRVSGGGEEFVSRLASSMPNLEFMDDGLGGVVQYNGYRQ